MKEVAEKDIRAYFDKNYLSYKIISVSLTNSEGKELEKKEKEKKIDKLEEYLKIYKDKGFEKAMDQYNKDNTAKGEKAPEATKDEDNRINEDATAMDENLVKEIRKLKAGAAKIVEYKSGGSTPTAALILRLDINDPKDLYEDSKENILISLKSEEFEKMVKETIASISIEFNEDVLEGCSPKAFAGIE